MAYKKEMTFTWKDQFGFRDSGSLEELILEMDCKLDCLLVRTEKKEGKG